MSAPKSKDPRKLPTQERAKETVRVVLDATDALIRAEHKTAITLTDIADKSGIAQGSIYQYFTTKEAILAAWEEREWARIAEAVMGELSRVIEERPVIEVAIRRLVSITARRVADHARIYSATGYPDFLSRSDERSKVAEQAVSIVAAALDGIPDRSALRVSDSFRAARVVVRILLTMPPVVAQATSEEERALTLRDIEHLVVAFLLGTPVPQEDAKDRSV